MKATMYNTGPRNLSLRNTLLACVFVLGGCAVGPDYARPELDTPQTFANSAPAETNGAVSDPAWWGGYGDPELDRLIELARGQNLTIQIAGARLQEAEALVRRTRSNFLPRLDGVAGAQVTRTSSQGVVDTERSAEGGLLLSWVPDVFGATRRAAESAERERQRREALAADAERLVVRAVIQVYIALRRDEAQHALVVQAIETRSKSYDLVTGREQAGLASTLDAARAATELATARALLPLLEQSVQANRAALDVLVAGWPGTVNPRQNVHIPVFASGPALTPPPAALLCRADVRAAEANLARATADIGVAVAARFGSITVPAQLSTTVIDIGTGKALESFIATIGAELNLPLFDGGGRRATVAAARARAQEALFGYRAALLAAAQEAENALAAVGNARDRRDALNEAERASATAYARGQDLYEQGLTDFLDVLDVQRTNLDTQRARLQAEADLGVAFADLYAAISVASPATMGEATVCRIDGEKA